jgi:hypothetical protein
MKVRSWPFWQANAPFALRIGRCMRANDSQAPSEASLVQCRPAYAPDAICIRTYMYIAFVYALLFCSWLASSHSLDMHALINNKGNLFCEWPGKGLSGWLRSWWQAEKENGKKRCSGKGSIYVLALVMVRDNSICASANPGDEHWNWILICSISNPNLTVKSLFGSLQLLVRSVQDHV